MIDAGDVFISATTTLTNGYTLWPKVNIKHDKQVPVGVIYSNPSGASGLCFMNINTPNHMSVFRKSAWIPWEIKLIHTTACTMFDIMALGILKKRSTTWRGRVKIGIHYNSCRIVASRSLGLCQSTPRFVNRFRTQLHVLFGLHRGYRIIH